ncbi:Uncharacterised protein [Actinobacillus equuli]|nr:Uncharacterised protein [Actinobacillus equuli]
MIDENLTQSSAPYVGLDNVTVWAKQILKSNANQSSKIAIGQSAVLEFFERMAAKPIFMKGNGKYN